MRITSRRCRQSSGVSSPARSSAASRVRRACALAIVASTVACASSSSTRSPSLARSPNLITAEEIARTNVQNAFEAVQKLRPAMLRQRQVATANAQANGELAVYVDNNRMGSVDNLRQITVGSIAAVRYFSASEAQLRWGSGHPGGVIEVITKR
jgi:hypothetical protein